jgi:hypothetical protein
VRRVQGRLRRIPRTGGGLIEPLETFLTEVAREAGASSVAGSAGIEFSHDRTVFASASGNVAEFRLEPEITEAALRTPSTEPSSRGPDWVRLSVQPDESHDLDRARAWFLSAWRNATGGG